VDRRRWQPPAADGAEGELDGDEHVEMVESTDEAADDGSWGARPRRRGRYPKRRAATIPGSHLRDPRSGADRPGRGAQRERFRLGPALPILPEAITQRPRRPKRSKPWFEEVFDEDYLRTLPSCAPTRRCARSSSFPMHCASLRAPRFSISLAATAATRSSWCSAGYNVTGLDLSLPLLLRAADEAKRRALSVNFVHADMREMAFEKQFDGAYSMLTSFGYFDEDTNLRVAERIGRCTEAWRRFLLDIVNRDYVVSDLPVSRVVGGNGCVVLEEVDFNFHTSRIVTHRSIVFEMAGNWSRRSRCAPTACTRLAVFSAGRLPRDGRLRRAEHARTVLRERFSEPVDRR
jgi:hypothetical protein